MSFWWNHLAILTILPICVRAQQLSQFLHLTNSLPYQSNYATPQSFLTVHNRISSIPENAVRPFERPLKLYNSTRVDMAVALLVTKEGGVWGRASVTDGTLEAVFIDGHKVRVLQTGFRLLIYDGTPENNGFRFSWMSVKSVDKGTLLYSGQSMHVPAVYADEGVSEYFGDCNWPKQEMEFVEFSTKEPHTVSNYGGQMFFDNDVFVLTKQRCNCHC